MSTATMKRPTVTRDMIAEAARKLATSNGWDDEQAADIADVYHHHMDGYELAKELERRHCWTITAMDVDSLDCMSPEVRDVHKTACIAWARDNDIQPPLPIGTITTRGEITGIYDHEPATYLVREHGETNESRRLLIRFEDAGSHQMRHQ